MLKYLTKTYSMILMASAMGPGPDSGGGERTHEDEIKELDHKGDGRDSSLDKAIKASLQKASDRNEKEYDVLYKFAQELIKNSQKDEMALYDEFKQKESEVILASANGTLELKEQVGLLDTAILESAYGFAGIEGEPLKEPTPEESKNNGSGMNFSKGLIDGLYLMGDGIDNLIADEAMREALWDSIWDGSIFSMIIDGMKETFSNLSSGEAYKIGRSSLEALLMLLGTGSVVKVAGVAGKQVGKGIMKGGKKIGAKKVEGAGAWVTNKSRTVENIGMGAMKASYKVPKFVVGEAGTIVKETVKGAGRGVAKMKTVEAGVRVINNGQDLVHHIVKNLGKGVQFTKKQMIATLDGLYKAGKISKEMLVSSKKYVAEKRTVVIKKAAEGKAVVIKKAVDGKDAVVDGAQAAKKAAKKGAKIVGEDLGDLSKAVKSTHMAEGVVAAGKKVGDKVARAGDSLKKARTSVREDLANVGGAIKESHAGQGVKAAVDKAKIKMQKNKTATTKKGGTDSAKSNIIAAKTPNEKLTNLEKAISQKYDELDFETKGTNEYNQITSRIDLLEGHADKLRGEIANSANVKPSPVAVNSGKLLEDLSGEAKRADALKDVATSGNKPIGNAADITKPIAKKDSNMAAAPILSDNAAFRQVSTSGGNKLTSSVGRHSDLDAMKMSAELRGSKVEFIDSNGKIQVGEVIGANVNGTLKIKVDVPGTKVAHQVDISGDLLYGVNKLDASGMSAMKMSDDLFGSKVEFTNAAGKIQVGEVTGFNSGRNSLKMLVKNKGTSVKSQVEVSGDLLSKVKKVDTPDVKKVPKEQLVSRIEGREHITTNLKKSVEGRIGALKDKVASLKRNKPDGYREQIKGHKVNIAKANKNLKKLDAKLYILGAEKKLLLDSNNGLKTLGVAAAMTVYLSNHQRNKNDYMELDKTVKDQINILKTQYDLSDKDILDILDDDSFAVEEKGEGGVVSTLGKAQAQESINVTPKEFMPIAGKGWEATVNAYNAKYGTNFTKAEFKKANFPKYQKWPNKGEYVKVPQTDSKPVKVASSEGNRTSYAANSLDTSGDEKSVETDPKDSSVTIKKGDNLWKIAEKELGSGHKYKDIMKWNNLTKTDVTNLKIGRKLILKK